MIQLWDPGGSGKGIGVVEWQKTHEGLYSSTTHVRGKGPWADSCEGRAQPMSEIRKLRTPTPLTRLIEAGDVSCAETCVGHFLTILLSVVTLCKASLSFTLHFIPCFYYISEDCSLAKKKEKTRHPLQAVALTSCVDVSVCFIFRRCLLQIEQVASFFVVEKKILFGGLFCTYFER